MKQTLINIWMIIALLLFAGCSSSRHLKPSDTEIKDKYVKVLDVLKVIQYAIEKAYAEQDTNYNPNPGSGVDWDNALNHLSTITVTFNNSLSKSVGGEVSFWVIKGGATHAREKSSAFTYTFSPLKSAAAFKSKFEKDAARLDAQGEQLVKALASLGTCLQKYKNDIYNLDTIDLEVAFKLTTSLTAGAEFKIGVVGISPEGELEWGNENTIALTFDMK